MAVKVDIGWKHVERKQSYPVRAADYLIFLVEGELLVGTPKQKVSAISRRKGIVYFGGFPGYSGHLTLWNGTRLHFQGENYWNQNTVIFWPMAD
jgi:hypothetical protein